MLEEAGEAEGRHGTDDPLVSDVPERIGERLARLHTKDDPKIAQAAAAWRHA